MSTLWSLALLFGSFWPTCSSDVPDGVPGANVPEPRVLTDVRPASRTAGSAATKPGASNAIVLVGGVTKAGTFQALQGVIVPAGKVTLDQKSQAVTIADIGNMISNGISDEIILRQIEITRTRVDLSVNDIISLHKQGASDRLIASLQDRTK